MRLVIDATNIRAGGGVTHIVNFIRHLEVHPSEVVEVYAARTVAKRIGIVNGITVHPLPDLLCWTLPRLFISAFVCDFWSRGAVCLVPGGTALGVGVPLIAMAQNVLPFAKCEIARFMLPRRVHFHFLRFAQGMTFKRSESVIFPSESARVLIEGALGKLRRTLVVPHGYSMPIESASIGSQHIFKGALVCFSIIEPYKNQTSVARAAFSVAREVDDFRVVFVGPEGCRKETAELKRIIASGNASLGRHAVQYTGSIPRESVKEMMKACRGVIIASSCESFGLVMLEAVSENGNVAVSDIGAFREIGKSAVVYFREKSEAEIEHALRTLWGRKGLAEDERRAFSAQFCWRQSTAMVAAEARAVWRYAFRSKQV